MGDGPPLQPGESSSTSRSATKDAKRFKKGKTETAAIHTWDEMMRREYLEMENMRYICGGLVLEALLTRSIGRKVEQVDGDEKSEMSSVCDVPTDSEAGQTIRRRWRRRKEEWEGGG